MEFGLQEFLTEAYEQRDDLDISQGMVCLTVVGQAPIYGHVANVTKQLVILNRVEQSESGVREAAYEIYIPLQHVTTARYADETEV